MESWNHSGYVVLLIGPFYLLSEDVLILSANTCKNLQPAVKQILRLFLAIKNLLGSTFS